MADKVSTGSVTHPHCIRIRPDRTVRILGALLAVLMAAVALTFLLLAFAGLVSGRIGPGIGLLAGAGVVGGLACAAVSFVRRQGAALTIAVCPDAIILGRRGEAVDSVARSEVGLVVVGDADRAGMRYLRIYGPDRREVGRWETNWLKGPTRTVRALRKQQYPWVVHNSMAPAVKSVLRSRLAPSWTDEVLA